MKQNKAEKEKIGQETTKQEEGKKGRMERFRAK
jgi:hypothetical protein